MRIAIPVMDGRISAHFGHCQEFYLYDADSENHEIKNRESVPAPPHKPGLLPRWLRERGAETIIASGMGSRAVMLFQENNIEVVTGVKSDDPDQAVKNYLNGTLEADGSICEH